MFFFIGVAYIILVYVLSDEKHAFSLMMGILFLVKAILHILQGMNYRIESLFGKAFLSIDEEKIVVKKTVFDKLQTIEWNNIKSINHYLDKYKITLNDNKIAEVNMRNHDYKVRLQIRQAISTLAQKKNILTDSF